jgi:DNA-binding NtrC family response regulator
MSDFGDFERMAASSGGVETGVQGKIFIVDDEPEIVEILSDLVGSLGFKVTGFTDSKAMLEAFRCGTPDAVLTDHKMPGTTGLELLDLIRKINPDVPVVMISGFLDRKELIQAISSGVFAVIEKPFDSDRVLQVCRNAVAFSQASQLLNRSLHLLLFHCGDIQSFLVSQGKADLAQTVHSEIQYLAEQRRKLQNIERG